ncbi:MAG: YtxH domain-containing protein [Candidatus Omnitrophica bacterium]|nr:YtxH domain-containing protein [Candidatus Omnitrophota bacterium]
MAPQRHTKRTVQTLGVFALGAAAGSIAALLFAPASGKVTRKRIAMKLRSVRSAAARQVGQAQKVLARKAGDLQKAAGKRLGHAREWMVNRMNGHAKRPIHPVRHRALHRA